ncbi:MAG: NTP transferase domain-containing protein [Candidatus Brocadiaceae bacterium]|nr:NTP transferase domain-containing protein [Candidatus Brocadiaceae bacterium]
MVKRIYNAKQIDECFRQTIHPELWTAIIPAAGRGLRLMYDNPKILFPVAGKPILNWLIALLSPFCEKFVFIFSPDGKEKIEPVLKNLMVPDRYQIAIQESANGMGDAIVRTKEHVKTKYSLIIWGDQVGIKKETIERSIRAHEQRENALLTNPTVWKKNPYIHFQRDCCGRIIHIMQAREEELMPEEGENDCGLFLFDTKALFDALSEAGKKKYSKGTKTEEFNLLPIIPSLDKNPGNVACLHIISEEETIGVNTRDDAELLSEILTKRRHENVTSGYTSGF